MRRIGLARSNDGSADWANKVAGFSRCARPVMMGCAQVRMLCAAAIVAGTVGCRGDLASPADGSADHRDAATDVVVDAGTGDLPQDGQDARDVSDARDAPGDTRDAPTDRAAADALVDRSFDTILDGVDAAGDVGDRPVDALADRLPDASFDTILDGVDAADDAGVDAADDTGVDAADDAGVDAADAGDDGAPSDAPVEAGGPYIKRDCGRLDACVCASNESCSFTCPGGDCAVTCASGSHCTVSCAAPFGCSIDCGDAECILACNLGVCAHFFGPARSLACDPAGTGCI